MAREAKKGIEKKLCNFFWGRAEEQSVLQGVRDGPGGSSSSPGLLSPLCQCTRGYSCVFLNFLSFFAFVILPFFIMKIILFSKIKSSSTQGCSPHSANAPEDTVVFFLILILFWSFFGLLNFALFITEITIF